MTMQLPKEIFTAVNLRRYTAVVYDTNGRPEAQTYTTIPIVASVQPAGPQDLLHLEEGNRTKDVIVVWSETEIRPGDESVGTEPDHIEWQGKLYECHMVERFNMLALPHYKATAIRHQV
jgi:hypothetical protein